MKESGAENLKPLIGRDADQWAERSPSEFTS